MSNLLWPGDERAGDLFSDEAFLAAMVAVEEAWLDALAGAGIAPAGVAELDLQRLVGPHHLEWSRPRSERGGNPAAALVDVLRDALADDSADGAALAAPRPDQPGRRRHRADAAAPATPSAVVADRDLREQVAAPGRPGRAPPRHADGRPHPHPARRAHDVRAQGGAVADRRPRRRTTPRRRSSFPVQVGGAAGTLAATVELAGDLDDPVGAATALSLELATALGLTASTPWHTTRSTVTRLGDARGRAAPTPGAGSPTTCSPCSRPEIGELAEGAAGGVVDDAAQGQPGARHARPPGRADQPRARRDPPPRRRRRRSTNAPTAPGTPSGPPCATLLRRTVVAAGQTDRAARRASQVHADRMAATLDGRERRRTCRAARDGRRSPGRAPVGRLRRRRRRASSRPRCARARRSARMTPVVTGVRMTGAAPPRRAAAAGARPVARHLAPPTLWTACARPPHRRLRRGRLGPARPRPQPVGARRAVHHGRAGRGRAGARRRRPGAARRRRDAVRLRRRLGRRRGRAAAAARPPRPRHGRRAALHRRADRRRRRCGPTAIEQVSDVGHAGAGRPRRPSGGSPPASSSASPDRAQRPAARARTTPTTPGYVQVCGALAAFDVRDRLGRDHASRCWRSPARRTPSRPPDLLREIADGVQRRAARRARRRRPPRPGRATRPRSPRLHPPARARREPREPRRHRRGTTPGWPSAARCSATRTSTGRWRAPPT